MTQDYFNAPLFIREHAKEPIDILTTPLFYIQNGKGQYTDKLPEGITQIPPRPTNPNLAAGQEYHVSGIISEKDNIGKNGRDYGRITEWGFLGQTFEYEPLWVTPENAAAFGITLVEEGQGIQVESPNNHLTKEESEYGVFAGHACPYQGAKNELFSFICTDLEHHDFPHVFTSADPEHAIVISVARYWHATNKICLADLWVPYGNALYVPPKPYEENAECIDLHNNRNAARSCYGSFEKNSLMTDILLQTQDTFTYWYWNAMPTIHKNPPIK